MVKTDYLLHKPAPPKIFRRLVTQNLFPLLIDAAGRVEGVFDTFSTRTRRRPLFFVVAVCLGGIAFAAAVERGRRRPTARSRAK